jgi:hypothetical protein
VAEALAHVALGRETPGTYTLTSVPAWSWREVHGYYAERAGVAAEIVEVPLAAAATAVPRLRARSWLRPVWRLALRQRDLLNDLAYRWQPALAERARAAYLRRRARQEIEDGRPEPWRPYLQERPVPGRRLTTLSDSRVSMHEDTKRVEARLAALV